MNITKQRGTELATVSLWKVDCRLDHVIDYAANIETFIDEDCDEYSTKEEIKMASKCVREYSASN